MAKKRRRKKKAEEDETPEAVPVDFGGPESDPDAGQKKMSRKDKKALEKLEQDVHVFAELTETDGWRRPDACVKAKKRAAEAALIDPEQTKNAKQLNAHQQHILAFEDVLNMPRDAVQQLNEYIDENPLFAESVETRAEFDADAFTVKIK